MIGVSRWVLVPVFLFAALGGADAQRLKPDFSKAEKHWIEDKAKHCWFADPDPAPNESINWSGPACDGALTSGDGVVIWTRDGKMVERDSGSFQNGMLAGLGKLEFEDGAFYEGAFPGTGVLTLPTGQRFAAISVKEAAGWSIEQDPRRIEALP